MRTFLVIVLVSSFAVACGGNAASPTPSLPSAPTDAKAVAGNIKEPGEAKVGDKTRCPVSGEIITVKESSPKFEYKGKTYYTCCDHCMTKLQAEPEKYLNAKK